MLEFVQIASDDRQIALRMVDSVSNILVAKQEMKGGQYF